MRWKSPTKFPIPKPRISVGLRGPGGLGELFPDPVFHVRACVRTRIGWEKDPKSPKTPQLPGIPGLAWWGSCRRSSPRTAKSPIGPIATTPIRCRGGGRIIRRFQAPTLGIVQNAAGAQVDQAITDPEGAVAQLP